jgi:hypothetical protein
MINERTRTIWSGIGRLFAARERAPRHLSIHLSIHRNPLFRLLLDCFGVSLELLEKTAFPFASCGALQYL